MEEAEVAELLGVSDRTVRREWTRARATLYKRLYLEPTGTSNDPSSGDGSPRRGSPG
jgi:hypothetical protein